jgi:hypothetical protein
MYTLFAKARQSLDSYIAHNGHMLDASILTDFEPHSSLATRSASSKVP